MAAERLAYKKLQEVDALIEILSEIDSDVIERSLKSLKKELDGAFIKIDAERRAERNLKNSRRVGGFYISKYKSSSMRHREILGGMIKVSKRDSEEMADIREIKGIISQLKQKPDGITFSRLERKAKSLIGQLGKDFDELFQVEIDVDIEEACKLRKVGVMLAFIRKLRMKKILLEKDEWKDTLVFSKLRNLEERCALWVSQDERTGAQLEILTRKLEEKASKVGEIKDIGELSFKLIIDPNNPDFKDWFDHCYMKMPDATNEDGSLSEEYEDENRLKRHMRKGNYFYLVAKRKNRVVGGIHFGYYMLPKWKGVIGYSGYNAVRPGFKDKGLGPKLAKVSEYYLRKIASQQGYRLIMVMRFIHERMVLPKGLHDRRTAKYLKKISARRLALGKESQYVGDHDFYLRLLGEWKNRKSIPKELLLDFLAAVNPDLYEQDAQDDKDFKEVEDSMKGMNKVLLEEVNI